MRDVRSLIAGVGIMLAVLPLLIMVRQAAILLVAFGLNAGSQLVETHLLPLLPVNPVYGSAGLRVLGGIEPRGLVVAGLPGYWLHTMLPTLFSDPSLITDGIAVSGLVESGVTVLASMVAALLATVLLLAATEILVSRASRRPNRRLLAVAARLGQLWLLFALASEARLSLRDVEASGLPFALAAFTPVDQHGQRVLLTTKLAHLPDTLIAAITALLAILCCLALASLVLVIGRGLRTVLAGHLGRAALTRNLTSWKSVQAVSSAAGTVPRPVWGGLTKAGLLVSLALVLSLTPLRSVAPPAIAVTPEPLTEVGTTLRSTSPGAGSMPIDVVPETNAASEADGAPHLTLTVASQPHTPTASLRNTSLSPVTLRGEAYSYQLQVDGGPWVVRGMGYNPWYASLPLEERQALYRRDFRLMRQIGVNTIQGWFHQQFDEVTLDEAHRFGLRVILPFAFDQDADYADPAVRARYRDEVTSWVLRYRDHPAVLMWGPGNEVLHRIIFPTVVQAQQDPTRDHRADEFARFLVELITVIHELDPSRPIIYRDAEDLYIGRLVELLPKQHSARSSFVYGTNVYTSRISEIISRWTSRGIDAPLLVSEFAPGGAGSVSRPRMLGRYWSTITAYPERVLGGVAYTWSTRGPEDLDRIFGLTDESGTPVDGSLDVLRELFRPAPLVSIDPG